MPGFFAFERLIGQGLAPEASRFAVYANESVLGGTMPAY